MWSAEPLLAKFWPAGTIPLQMLPFDGFEFETPSLSQHNNPSDKQMITQTSGLCVLQYNNSGTHYLPQIEKQTLFYYAFKYRLLTGGPWTPKRSMERVKRAHGK